MLDKSKKSLDLDFQNKTVLITGGTRGIGLETGLSFSKYGAQCILTFSWGDHDEEKINAKFNEAGGKLPIIIQADVAKQEDTENLMLQIKEKHERLEIFISNVSVSMIVQSLKDYTLKGLQQSLSYSSWPLVSYTQKIKENFGCYPRYIIGVSSTGPDDYSFGYDFAAASKSVMECLCRYLNFQLRKENVVINSVRSRAIKTESFHQTFGNDLASFTQKFVPDNYWIEPFEVADAIVGLCSGYCDAIRGQTITVDRGTHFFDNLMDIYTRHQKGKLDLKDLSLD